jgi:hypothetical protein
MVYSTIHFNGLDKITDKNEKHIFKIHFLCMLLDIQVFSFFMDIGLHKNI